MKRMDFFKNISSFLLAVLVIFSSTSYLVDIHFCCGDVEEVSVFVKTEGCNPTDAPPVCHISKNSCCEDFIAVHEGLDFESNPAVKLLSPTYVLVSVPVQVMGDLNTALTRGHAYADYDPPAADIDRTVSFLVFRI